MENSRDEFIEKNSPCGGFLQSNQWINFQNKIGIKNHIISDRNFWSNILEYRLPGVGKYFYIPRGPVLEKDIAENELKTVLSDLIELAKINKAGWIRVDIFDERMKKVLMDEKNKIVRAPHDMQPKQLFIIDIDKGEEEILAQMKPKTRYNIKLAQKRGVTVAGVGRNADENIKVEKFLELIKKTANRKEVVFHKPDYYKQMLQNISEDNLNLYLATYNNDIVAGALLVTYGEMATYLHGASADNYRNVMAPFLLQWEMIKIAKARGCKKYDFGGISINEENKLREKKWQGVTKFKQGFAKQTEAVEFSGSYDIIINPIKYWTYRTLQKIRSIF